MHEIKNKLCSFEIGIDSHLPPHEDFIGLHVVDNIATDTIVHVPKDTVLYMNLSTYVPCILL